VDSDQVDITGMNVTVFSGGPDAKVDSVILSPAGVVLINEKVATATGTVRLIRDDVEVTGEGLDLLPTTRKKFSFPARPCSVPRGAARHPQMRPLPLLAAVAILARPRGARGGRPRDHVDCSGRGVGEHGHRDHDHLHDKVVAVGNGLTLTATT
jgi:hypothetical protein